MSHQQRFFGRGDSTTLLDKHDRVSPVNGVAPRRGWDEPQNNENQNNRNPNNRNPNYVTRNNQNNGNTPPIRRL